jgi:hypothetical protein
VDDSAATAREKITAAKAGEAREGITVVEGVATKQGDG